MRTQIATKPNPPAKAPDLSRATVNRQSRSIIEARTDVEAVRAWLRARAKHSKQTFDRYARQGRRLLIFLESRGETLDTMTLHTIEAYATAMKAGEVGNGPLSPKYVDDAFVVIKSMVSMLVIAGYLRRNPLVLRAPDTNKKKKDVRLERYLCDEQITALLAEASALNATDSEAADARRAARTRFLLIWFLITGARITETLNARMSDIYSLKSKGETHWYWYAYRKGGQETEIPLRRDAVEALATYRRSLGLDSLPTPSEAKKEGHLVWPLNTRSTTPLYRSSISRDLKIFFKKASLRLDDEVLAKKMCQASAHWLRHTAATQLLDSGAHMRFVSRLLGHSSIVTTSSIYDHIERDKWRIELEKGREFRLDTP